MEYPMITTKAFILHTYEDGEQDRKIIFFTEKLGRVIARARSIRKAGAKLKGFIIPYNFLQVTLIEGREYILKETSYLHKDVGFCDGRYRKEYIHTLKLLNYLLRDRGEHSHLFNTIEDFFTNIEEQEYDNKDAFKAIQSFILSDLGYLDLRERNPYYVLNKIQNNKIDSGRLDLLIEQALQSSGLVV